MKLKKVSLIILTSLSILLTGCYSDYVFLEHNFKTFASQWNNDSTEIAFIQISKAYRKPKGLAKLPDGGQSKVSLNKAKLYSFNVESQSLNELYDFEELIKSPIRNRWDAKIIFLDTFVYFKISNTNHWETYKNWANSKSDTAKLDSLIDKYSNYFKISILTRNISKIDSLSFYQNYDKNDYLNVSEIKKITSEIPLKNWGLDLQNIYPQSDKTFIKQLIHTEKGHSSITRRAIVEQIIAHKSKAEIIEILNEMDKHKNSLQGLEKTIYESSTKETYELIQSLL